MSEVRAATLRFLYMFMLRYGVSKERAREHLAEVSKFDDRAFSIFLNGLTLLLQKETDTDEELVTGSPPDKDLN